MSSAPYALPKDVLKAIEDRIQLIGDSRAGTMRRIVKDENIVNAWDELSKGSTSREERISTLYLAVYETGWILQRPEMMTRGEARKIVEGLELLANYENSFFLTTKNPLGESSFPLLFPHLLEKYRVYAQEIPTGARRRPKARSLATRLCSIFRETMGKPCHEAVAALIRAAHGGDCDAETVRTYDSRIRRKCK